MACMHTHTDAEGNEGDLGKHTDTHTHAHTHAHTHTVARAHAHTHTYTRPERVMRGDFCRQVGTHTHAHTCAKEMRSYKMQPKPWAPPWPAPQALDKVFDGSLDICKAMRSRHLDHVTLNQVSPRPITLAVSSTPSTTLTMSPRITLIMSPQSSDSVVSLYCLGRGRVVGGCCSPSSCG